MSNLLNELFSAYSIIDFSTEEDKHIKRDYLDEVKEFALSGTYTGTKHKEYLIKNFMKPVQDQATDLGLSKAAVYKNRNLILKDLENRLGSNIIKNILNGRYEEVDRILNNNLTDQSLGEVIIRQVIDAIRERATKTSSKSRYDLLECTEEIKLLKKYSVLDLETLLDKVSVDKLTYLIRLINYEESDVEDRVRLMEVIKSNRG